jgi:hypothetical protein
MSSVKLGLENVCTSTLMVSLSLKQLKHEGNVVERRGCAVISDHIRYARGNNELCSNTIFEF